MKTDTNKTEKINLAMAAILKDIAAISKDRKNEQQGFKFRGIDDIYNHLHPILAAHGVVCIPEVRSVTLPEVIKNAKGNNVYRSIVQIAYTFVASDGSTLSGVTVGEGMDFADKATAKALSAAHKYVLIQTFLIPTVEVAEQDYDTTVDPHEELKALDEQAKREAELKRQQDALDTKRQAAKDKLAASGPPAGSTPVEEVAAPAPQKPAKGPKITAPPEPSPEEDEAHGDEPGEAEEEPEVEEEADGEWSEHEIKAIKHKKYSGRTVGSLDLEELLTLKENWIEKFADQIDADKDKSELRKYLLEALAHRQKQK